MYAGITSVMAQTCCSGGVPVSSNIGFQSSNAKTLQLAFSFEQNSLKSLYSGSDELNLNNRERLTNSLLLRGAYNFTDKWNVEILLPFVNQVRNITQNNGSINSESSKGIGDLVVLAKYDIVKNETWGINIGIGPKLPTGKTDSKNTNGLLLVNDLQPGSGTLDILSRISLLYAPAFRTSMSLYVSGVLSLKGTDDNYLGSQSYKFGNEYQLFAGASDQLIIGSNAFYPSFSFRYRNASRDGINKNPLENTGGKWLFLKSGFGMDLYRDHRISISAEIPLITQVDGTQLSPNLIFNLSYHKSLSFDNSPSSTIKL